MFDNANQLPVSGGVMLGSLLYAGLSILYTGPIVAERTIEKSNWNAQCKIALTKKIEASRQPKKIIPRTDCRSMLGSIIPELAKICNQYGNFDLGGPAANLLRTQERQRLEVEEKKLALATSEITSQCSCAATMVATTNDMQWAIHTGSFRLITPTRVTNLNSELSRALHSPYCAGRSVL